MCVTIGVVFDGLNGGGYVVFFSFEVDDSVSSFVSSSAMVYGYFSCVVTPCCFFEGFKKGFLGCFFCDGGEVFFDAEAFSGCCGFCFFEGHCVWLVMGFVFGGLGFVLF